MTDLTAPKFFILYADDDLDDLQLVEEAFSNYSSALELRSARDGVEALSYLMNLGEEDMVPCLIILDINMPRMSGKEVLVRLRQVPRFEKVPVILFTTSSMPLDISFAEQYNAGFLTKPIDIRQMDNIASKFMDRCSEEVRNAVSRESH